MAFGQMGAGFGEMGLVSSTFGPALPASDVFFDFTTNIANLGFSGSAASQLTTTRAGTAYADNLAGTWTSFAANAPRITDKGLLVEEARTNSIRNNSMTGAVPGTPGTLPTNWFYGTVGGLTTQVVGTGVDQGIDYIDLRFFGTTTSTSLGLLPEATTQIAAVQNQTWADTLFVKLVGGSLTNIDSVRLFLTERNAGGTTLTAPGTPLALFPTAAWQRFSIVSLLPSATAAFVSSTLTIAFQLSVAIDITLRIGWPQLELGGFVTSPIRTTGATVTRAADNVTLTTPPTFGTAASLYAAGTPNAPTTAAIQTSLTASDNTANNRLELDRTAATGTLRVTLAVAGTPSSVVSSNVLAQATAMKTAGAYQAADQIGAANGVLTSALTAAGFPAGMNKVTFGAQISAPTAMWNGTITQAAIWATQRLTNTQLQSITTSGPIQAGIPRADVYLDFVANTAQVSATSSLTTTRAGTAYADDTSGNWTSFGTNIPRQTNRGLLVEEQRTNAVLNSAAVGAVPGTPGTAPTGWTLVDRDGLSHTVVGTGTENGIDYIDIRIFGTTTTSTGGRHILFLTPDTSASLAAANGQTWTGSVFVTLVGGSLANLSLVAFCVAEYNSGGTVQNQTPVPFIPRAGNLGQNRFVLTRTLNQATTAFVNFWLTTNPTSSGLAIDYTFRIGWPQLELGAFVTSPIRTTAAAVTRATDVVKMTTPPTLGPGATFYGAGSTNAPLLSAATAAIVAADDGTTANRMLLRRAPANSLAQGIIAVGGSVIGSPQSVATIPQATPVKLALALVSTDVAIALNGVVAAFSEAAGFPATTNLVLGAAVSSSQPWNGYITQASVWATQRLTNAQLQSVTT